MIKEMSFIDAVRFAKSMSCYFRPEFSNNWISSEFLWVSRYGVPIKDVYGSKMYIKLDPSITGATRWEFFISEEAYKKLNNIIEKLRNTEDTKKYKPSAEQFPSPVRLCSLNNGDMFKLANDVNGGWYCNYGLGYDGKVHCADYHKNPDDGTIFFAPNTLVYKTNKNGEIVDATSEV